LKIPLLSHVNADGDILEAWFAHHMQLGVTSFHLIVHGPRSENQQLHALVGRYPVHIEDSYEGAFDPWEKRDRLNRLLGKFRQMWVVEADSDEFLELPYARLPQTVRLLSLAGADVLFAPMLQHVSRDGSLDTPEVMTDPFAIQPLCSVNLYDFMGCKGDIRKYPLFLNRSGTSLFDGGNHNRPVGCVAESTGFRGATHHFKFRRHVRERLQKRMNSAHPYRGESADMFSYLEQHGMRLPLDDSFLYSRREMFRRRLLLRPGLKEIAAKLIRVVRPRK
jgi:hypothetical protein